MDWIGLGPKLIGLDWVGLRKLDPCPTLMHMSYSEVRTAEITVQSIDNVVKNKKKV